MALPFDGSASSAARLDYLNADRSHPTTICFAQRLAASASFKALFKEGMSLVEESATYLDGPGRQESKTLRRSVAIAYGGESMRLTTRLMQLASWLLLQRAVNEGEMSVAQASSERHRVKLSHQEIACAPELFEELPPRLRSLSFRSMRLQARVLHLDQSLAAARLREAMIVPNPIAGAVERLRIALAAH